MINLPNVTLVCISDIKIKESIEAMSICMRSVKFGAVKLLSSKNCDYDCIGIEKVKINPTILSKDDYSKFVLSELNNYFNTDFVMVCQHDGFILNAKAWIPEFLDYDYIGAPYNPRHEIVGNGGFSIRSKRLQKYLQEYSGIMDMMKSFVSAKNIPEDEIVGVTLRQAIKNKGMIVAPLELAEKFSIEGGIWNNEFGFHDFYVTNISNYKYPNDAKDYKAGLHSGDIGDIIYGIPTFKQLGITKLVLNTDGTQKTMFTASKYKAIKPYLEWLGFEVCEYKEHKGRIHYYLDAFRNQGHEMTFTPLSIVQARSMGVDIDLSQKWLKAPIDTAINVDIVVSRTHRYQNEYMNYSALLRDFLGYKIVFLGLDKEYEDFIDEFQLPIKHIKTENFLQAATIINSAKIFIGNQNGLYSVAEGLKVNRIQEVSCIKPIVPNALPMSKNGYPVICPNDLIYAKNHIKRWLK